MAFTKINAAGIGTTETVTVDGLTVINDGSFGGNLTVSGVLTYEDVTNVDSVGLITARNGIVVGSGITLSKDGDVFFTGIATGNGSGLTALNASNISSGTVPTARLGSGTASSSTFLRGDSTFQTVNTDLVSDTSPQLGGDLASNGNDILMADSDQIKLGTGNDLSITHNGSHSEIADSGTGDLRILTSKLKVLNNPASADELMIQATENGAVELYYNNVKTFETKDIGAIVYNNTGSGNRVFDIKNPSNDYAFISLNDQNTTDNSKVRIGALANEMLLYSGAGEVMRLSDDGKVGFNNTDPSAAIELSFDSGGSAPVSGTAPEGIAISYGTADGKNGGIWFSPGFGDDQGISGINANRTSGYQTDLRFYTNSTNSARAFSERARIEPNGRIQIGHTSSIVGGKVEVHAATAETQITINESSDSGTGPALYINRTRGSNLSSPSPVENNNYIGSIHFGSYDTSSYEKGASIICVAHGQTWANSDCPSRLMFLTTPDNSQTPTEKLRILPDGQIFSNGLDGSVDITVTGAADTYDGIQMGKPPFRVTRTSNVPAYLNRTGSGGNIIQFRYGGSVVGSISNNSNSLPSDRNYKKDITNLTLGLDLVNKLQPVSYHYKFDADSDPVMYGLIAQDVETALNDAGVAQNKASILQYEEKNDEKDSDYSLDYIKFTPILINAVKELSAEIESLKSEIAALKG